MSGWASEVRCYFANMENTFNIFFRLESSPSATYLANTVSFERGEGWRRAEP